MMKKERERGGRKTEQTCSLAERRKRKEDIDEKLTRHAKGAVGGREGGRERKRERERYHMRRAQTFLTRSHAYRFSHSVGGVSTHPCRSLLSTCLRFLRGEAHRKHPRPRLHTQNLTFLLKETRLVTGRKRVKGGRKTEETCRHAETSGKTEREREKERARGKDIT